jgi:hypothetical protein
MSLYDEMRSRSDASLAYSRRRRLKSEGERRFERALLILALIGTLVLIKFVTYPFPLEQWPIGLVGVLLALPYLTRRFQ